MVPLLITILAVLVVGQIALAVAWRSSARRFRARLSSLDRAVDECRGAVKTVAVQVKKLRIEMPRDTVSDESMGESMAEQVDLVRRTVDELRGAVESVRELKTERATPSAARNTRDDVEVHLRRQGYDEVSFLSGGGGNADESGAGGLGTDRADGAIRVSLSARKDGILYKGYAMIEDGVVTRSRLNPTYRMFP